VSSKKNALRMTNKKGYRLILPVYSWHYPRNFFSLSQLKIMILPSFILVINNKLTVLSLWSTQQCLFQTRIPNGAARRKRLSGSSSQKGLSASSGQQPQPEAKHQQKLSMVSASIPNKAVLLLERTIKFVSVELNVRKTSTQRLEHY
jgi:hypothetical protein